MYQSGNEFFNTEYIKSGIDGNQYKVVSLYDDKQTASDLIAKINIFSLELIKNLKTYENMSENSTNAAEVKKGKEIWKLLNDKFNPKALSENEPNDENQTSYTTNKGEKIALCLREKQSGKNKLHDLNTLKFVVLHELAHIITPEYKHSDNFWINFRFLIEYSEKKALFKSYDYSINNIQYCGLDVRHNPAFADTKKTKSYFV